MLNIDVFAKKVSDIHQHLAGLYETIDQTSLLETALLPTTFVELGVASEELTVVSEELRQQNQELIEARQALESERDKYQSLFDLSPDAYLITDPEGVILEANQVAADLFNVSQRFLAGKPLVNFVPQAERRQFRSEFLKLYRAERAWEWATQVQPRNGQSCDIAVKVSINRNASGQTVSLSWLLRDMTERNRAASVLQKKNYEADVEFPAHLYTKGEVIPVKPQTIWLVQKGLVKLSTFSEQGEEILIGLIGSSMPFGPDLTSLSTYQAVVLSEEAQLVSLNLMDMTTSPELCQTFMAHLNQRLQQTEALLAISGQRRVQDRLRHLLLMLKREVGRPGLDGTRISVRLTHEDLANACCTTRVTVTRLLGKLQRQNKIGFDLKHHLIIRESL